MCVRDERWHSQGKDAMRFVILKEHARSSPTVFVAPIRSGRGGSMTSRSLATRVYANGRQGTPERQSTYFTAPSKRVRRAGHATGSCIKLIFFGRLLT
jgi:hypothetical protein